ncbi:hypothetical protein RZS08_60300, partial [Arthrospira platensis SPKY1]|nr:hypothetical protein [Arthrospira platensis SPKY1]
MASEERRELLKHQNTPQGVTFEFGENEQKLFRFLRSQGRISVSEYANLIHETSYRASKILVQLVAAGVQI